MTEQDRPQLQSGLITKVERQRRGPHRYNIYIDESFAFSVHEDLMIKHRLLKGEAVEAAQLEQILAEDEAHKAYLDAIRLLSSRLRSEHEMKARLKQKGYTPEITAATVERLAKEGYLNDEQFAEQLAKQRLESQKKGRHWIKQELQQKGIRKDHIQAAMEQVDEETEFEMAYSLASKRYHSELAKDPLKARRKIAGFLQRRGYPGTVVSKVLARLPRKGPEGDWDEEMLPEEEQF
ncbi:RecX family transcriptional regulator [Paenibacillus ehimensis]|uniref:RecX family transcriptional regulator n=1 Tax=Paenibacillus ehimensis TaxID=79264 RepID=UPI000FD6FBB3|nr:RecX family transcriptional regulator [Paenibacillus ehimensis]